MPKLAGLDGGNGGLNPGGGSTDAAQVVGGKFENRNAATGEVLLVTDVLIGRNEQVEAAFGQAQQVAILDASLAAFLGVDGIMANEEIVHWPRHALVQQDSHAGVGASKAVSDRSKTLQAISRVTNGKHSRNSSSV